MRLTPCQAALAAAIALNLLLLCSRLLPAASPPCHPRAVPASLPGVTVILRDFDGPDHDVAATARSFSSLPGVPVLVAAEVSPYPPVPLPAGVTVLSLRPQPHRPPPRPELAVRTRHVALVPDGARAAPGLLRRMRDALEAIADGDDTKMVAAAVGRQRPRCLSLEVDVKAWTVRYGYQSGQSDRGERCGALDGAPAVLLLRTRDLFSLPFPLSSPALTALSLQAAVRGWRILLLPDSFPSPPRPPPSPKARNAAAARRRALLERFGVKLEVLPDGARRWHGCAKDTPRCFGTIRAQTPEYLLEGRWTPPCCLRALRATACHVLAQLEAAGVRHWLEGGSLLGAVRLGDIIPWDYDVDVGLYRDDVPKCRWLAAVQASGRPVEDPEGFLWEKAAEGEFFRVHYSRTNRLHVDLWPFYVGTGGMMTKETWLGHRQDVEFPESLVAPLGSVAFAGLRAKAPNDPRAFLEFKFGPGVIERPEYPNPAVRSLAQDNKTSW
ncbi:fukutin-related protein isoform X3 [Catharus ustulatus]|uniref:Ribitol-5-phosphate transferase n=1 Tax=Catharus ustulatus TaxID=91951 RepID=A0A8C3USG1_CATUS|nr:fukutin-related protein isoform X1 [Catharus ustulatus]XP_032939801.1 fukutin-related protein isoform X2 [Catharus ustulatus]XP_032939802.1 fukutin-related protein isoform X3 [Catharus ustulatus]